MSEHSNADPAKPYKAIAAAVMAAITVLVVQGQDILPTWALLALAALAAGLATYVVPNPSLDAARRRRQN